MALFSKSGKPTKAAHKAAAKAFAKTGTPARATPTPENPPTATHPATAAGHWVTKTTTTPAPAVAPFLTPAQQEALSKWNTTFGNEIAKYAPGTGTADEDALAKFTNTWSADQFRNANAQDTTYQSMAARGLGQSSIRQNALNDLAATLTQQYNVLDAAYKTTMQNDALAYDNAQGTNNTTQLMYNSLAIQNAQGVAPNTQGTTQTTSQFVTNPAQSGAQPQQPIHQAENLGARASGMSVGPAGVANPAASARSASIRSAPTTAAAGTPIRAGQNLGKVW